MIRIVPSISGPFILNPKGVPNMMRHWKEICPVYLPEILVSYGTYISTNVKWLPEEFHFEKENIIFIDSGGFQIAERGLKIDVNDVINAQLKFVNSLDVKKIILFPLDYPPAGRGKLANITVGNIKKKAKKTCENTKKLINSASNTDAEVYAIFQYVSEKYADIWWRDGVKPVLKDVDGVAVGIKPLRQMHNKAPLSFLYMYEHGVENIHCFMGTGMKMMNILPLFENKFKLLTFDSATYSFSSGKGRIFTPLLGSVTIGNKASKRDTDFKDVQCLCPVCKTFFNSDLSYALKNLTSKKYVIISLHNLYHIAQYLNDCIIMRRDNFESYVEKTSKVVGLSSDFIWDTLNSDYDTVRKKYYGGNLSDWF